MNVFIRGNRYYISYTLDGKTKQDPTGLKVDRKDWRRSVHRESLEAFIHAKEEEILQRKGGKHWQLVAKRVKRSPEQILEEYKAASSRERRALQPGTITRKANAIKLLRKFAVINDIRDVDETLAGDFRLWAESRLKDSTLQGYITDLKSLYGFALEKEYITKNPFKAITVPVEVVPKLRTRREYEYSLFDFLYSQNRNLFEQCFQERIAGWRVQDICKLPIDAPKVDHFELRNQKGKRIELFPVSEVNRWLLSILPRRQKYLYHFRNRTTVNYQLGLACAYAGVPKITTHKLKSDYISEFRKQTGDPDLISFLGHHAFQGQTRVSAVHYLDPEVLLEEGKDVLDRAQQHWMEFVLNLKEEPRRTYAWSNPKGHWRETAQRRKLLQSVAEGV